jgi:hypothetical protein
MATRIIFNGKEYATPEAMPEEVRKMYQRALAQLADADQQDVPDMGRNSEPSSALDQGLMWMLDQSQDVLSTALVLVLAAAAGAVIVFGTWIITHMDQSSRSQGGVIYVTLGMVVVLGVIAAQFVNLWWRKGE